MWVNAANDRVFRLPVAIGDVIKAPVIDGVFERAVRKRLFLCEQLEGVTRGGGGFHRSGA